MAIDFSKYDKSSWLKGSDLEQGEFLPVTVEAVSEHTFPSGDESIVVKFLELDKRLVLNKTRRDKLIEMLGSDDEEWLGHRITLYPVDVSFQGKTTVGVAIGAVPRKKAAKPVVEDDDDDTNGDVVFQTKGIN